MISVPLWIMNCLHNCTMNEHKKNELAGEACLVNNPRSWGNCNFCKIFSNYFSLNILYGSLKLQEDTTFFSISVPGYCHYSFIRVCFFLKWTFHTYICHWQFCRKVIICSVSHSMKWNLFHSTSCKGFSNDATIIREDVNKYLQIFMLYSELLECVV